MKIIVDIPTELEKQYKSDKFVTTFNRVKTDLSNLRGSEPTCNKYELHTIVLLAIALKNSKIFVEDKNL